MSDLQLQPLPLAGLYSVQHKRHGDARGQFARLFCEGSLAGLDVPFHIRQINHSRTLGSGSVRGLHYQQGEQPEAGR